MTDAELKEIRERSQQGLSLPEDIPALLAEIDRLKVVLKESGHCIVCGASDWLCLACGEECGGDHSKEADDVR